MFGTVRKHQTWLWVVVIAIIIISFVFFFSPSANLDMTRNDGNFGTINGKPITRDEFVDAYKEVRLLYRLQAGEWPGNEDVMRMRGFDIEQESYTRLLLTKKIEEMNLQIPPDAIVRWISDLFKRGGAQGGSIADQYQQFIATQLVPNGLTATDFERFARHQVAQQHLTSVFGLSGGLIPRSEAEDIYKRENEMMQADIIFFSATNYVNQVNPTDDDLLRHFNLNKPAYRIPDRIQIEYVRFDASNFLAAAEVQFNADTNINLMLERVYFERGTNSFKDDAGNTLTLEQAKPKLKNEYLERLALVEARKHAAEFINKVDEYQQKNPNAKDALATVAGAEKLKIQETPLLDQGTDIRGLNLPFAFRNAAFKLSDEGQFTTSPVLSEEGIFVLSLKNKVEGKIPELAAVKDRVAEDYKKSKALELARNAGEKFQQTLTSGLAEKKSFESLLIIEKAQSVSLPPFNLLTQNMPELAGRLTLDRLQNAATGLTPGQSSELIGTENGGAIVYLRERKEVDPAKLNAEIEKYSERIRDQRQYAAYVAWLSKLEDEMQLSRPVAQRQAQR